MSWNLLVWQWSEELDTPSKRRKYKTGDVATVFGETGDHPAIANADFEHYLHKVVSHFGPDEESRPFVIERYGKCVVFNYGSDVRYEIIPILGQFASLCGFNATEF